MTYPIVMAILVLSLIAVVIAAVFITDDASALVASDSAPDVEPVQQIQSTFAPVTGESQHNEPGVMEFPEETDRDAGAIRI